MNQLIRSIWMDQEWRIIVVIYAMMAVLAAYPLLWLWRFDVLGYPVISHDDYWLGPPPRQRAECLSDVGKVMRWMCADESVFQSHATFCAAWLRYTGLVNAGGSPRVRVDTTDTREPETYSHSAL
ncbi:hypothetical protein C7S18_13305 [Ahniella affigens]|uniref:Uncharacterized protein n=1 Tax=Ahniella affigens TaxID=2021234 RepID=A0A2P1PTE0_9GAMM|nr:hypothetical protein [Ahniella affigens]AVP98114.1 hypothetical protein C7S18_13305 [Ahniella affigens]